MTADESPLAAGVGDQAVRATVNALRPNMLYHYRVSATNNGGTVVGSDMTFTTSAIAPAVSTTPATSVTPGMAVLNGLIHPNNASTNAYFEYGETSSFGTQVPAIQSPIEGDVEVAVSATVGGLSPNRTYRYRLVGSNIAGMIVGAEQVFSTPLPPYPSAYALNTTVTFPLYSKPSDYASSDWRMVGLPGNSNQPISSLLTGAVGSDWQVYWDNGAGNDYLIPYSDGGQFLLSAGRGYWLIRKGNWAVNTSVSTADLDASQVVKIPLHAGWNIVANPFNTTIPWSVLQNVNGISEPIHSYEGAFAMSSEFAPYRGYYYFNAINATELIVPYSALFPVMEDQTRQGVADWEIEIHWMTGGKRNSTLLLGVGEQADDGLDEQDYRKPREFGSWAGMYFDRPVWDPEFNHFMRDIRSPVTDTKSWTFRVASDSIDVSEMVVTGIAKIPDRFAVYLVDHASDLSWNLRTDSVYRFSSRPFVSNYSIVVGAEDQVEALLAEVTPKVFELGNSFPNPFNASTNISISLPDAAHAVLAVYSVRGELIRTLHEGRLDAGTHWFEWDGTDATSRAVASGVYYLKGVGTSGQVLMKKMILMK